MGRIGYTKGFEVVNGCSLRKLVRKSGRILTKRGVNFLFFWFNSKFAKIDGKDKTIFAFQVVMLRIERLFALIFIIEFLDMVVVLRGGSWCFFFCQHFFPSPFQRTKFLIRTLSSVLYLNLVDISKKTLSM